MSLQNFLTEEYPGREQLEVYSITKCSTQKRLNEFHPAELLHILKFPVELKAPLHEYLRKLGTCYFPAQYYLCKELINKSQNLMDIIPTFTFPASRLTSSMPTLMKAS